MGRFKTLADQTNKSILKNHVNSLDKRLKLVEAVTANLVREIAAKGRIESLIANQATNPDQVASNPNEVASAAPPPILPTGVLPDWAYTEPATTAAAALAPWNGEIKPIMGGGEHTAPSPTNWSPLK